MIFLAVCSSSAVTISHMFETPMPRLVRARRQVSELLSLRRALPPDLLKWVQVQVLAPDNGFARGVEVLFHPVEIIRLGDAAVEVQLEHPDEDFVELQVEREIPFRHR